ncbi:MAG TPA: hypothetical protein GXX72_05780 [Clostridiaceae bacterium]|nr:hypothetical protein [Clostridiaceae bacterium]
MNCHNCGQTINEEDLFCPYCGVNNPVAEALAASKAAGASIYASKQDINQYPPPQNDFYEDEYEEIVPERNPTLPIILSIGVAILLIAGIIILLIKTSGGSDDDKLQFTQPAEALASHPISNWQTLPTLDMERPEETQATVPDNFFWTMPPVETQQMDPTDSQIPEQTEPSVEIINNPPLQSSELTEVTTVATSEPTTKPTDAPSVTTAKPTPKSTKATEPTETEQPTTTPTTEEPTLTTVSEITEPSSTSVTEPPAMISESESEPEPDTVDSTVESTSTDPEPGSSVTESELDPGTSDQTDTDASASESEVETEPSETTVSSMELTIDVIDATRFPTIRLYYNLIDENGAVIQPASLANFTIEETLGEETKPVTEMRLKDRTEFVSLIDGSAQTLSSEADVQLIQNAHIDLVNKVLPPDNVNNRMGLTVFASDFTQGEFVLPKMYSSSETLVEEIGKITPTEPDKLNSPVYDAIYATVSNLNAKDYKGAVVVYTYGNDSGSSTTKKQLQDLVSHSAIAVHILSLSESSDLADIAMVSRGTYNRIDDLSILGTALISKYDCEAEADYIEYISPFPLEQENIRTVKLSYTNDDGVTVEAVKDYLPPPTEPASISTPISNP